MSEQLGFSLFDEPEYTKEQIKQANCQLITWAYEYYQQDKPTVSDAEYDGLYQTYLKMLKTTDYRPFSDMSVKVGNPTKYAFHAAQYGLRRNNEETRNNN